MKIFLTFLLFTTFVCAKTLFLSLGANPSVLNPLIAVDSTSHTITNFIFNGLVKYDKDGLVVGDLAKSYSFENNTTLVFDLRQNVKWHDGKEFTADDVVFTYTFMHQKNLFSPYTSTFRQVKSVEKLEKYKLKVTYKKPYFKALDLWMSAIVPKHILETDADPMYSDFNKKPIGTGPYKLKKMKLSESIILEAYDEYFEGRAKIDRLSFTVIADPTTSFLMLKTRKLDYGNLLPMQYERMLNDRFRKNFDIIEMPSHSYTYLGFNLRNKKFKDARVRKAISLAINRKEIIDIITLGHGTVCKGPFLPGSPAFNKNVKVPEFNPAKAKELLKKAGYSEEYPLEFELTTSNNSPTRPYVAEMMQFQLKRIGVKVQLKVMEWQAFLNMVVKPHDFEALILGWSLGLAPDPYNLWHSSSDKKGGYNFIGYHNAEVDDLIIEMESIVEKQALAKIQRKIFEKIVADNPYLFLYIPNSIEVINKNISPIEPSINGIWHNQIKWEINEN